MNARGTRRPHVSKGGYKRPRRSIIPPITGGGGPAKTGGCAVVVLMALGDLGFLASLLHIHL